MTSQCIMARRAAFIAAILGLCYLFGVIDLHAAAEPAKRPKPAAKATRPGQAAKSAQATPAKAAVQAAKSFDLDFKEFKLNNGLRVLLAEDHSAPTFSICLTYNVG
ncbi:MAG: hypothetical protein ACREPG_02195, partial [Candidatus Binatia bacterium]